MVRKILAVVSGFVLWSVLWVGAGATATALAPEAYNEDGSTENTGLLLTFLVLSILFSLGAGFLAAVFGRTLSLAPAWTFGAFF